MVEVYLEINETTNEDLSEFDTYAGSITTEELVGAEVVEVIDHKYGDIYEVDELKLRLKDGRHLRVCADNIGLIQWSDDNANVVEK